MADVYLFFPREIYQLIILADPSTYPLIARLNKYCNRAARELIPHISQKSIIPRELRYNAKNNPPLCSDANHEFKYSQPLYSDTIHLHLYNWNVGPHFLRLSMKDNRVFQVEEFYRIFNTEDLSKMYDRLKRHNYHWLDFISLYRIYSQRLSCMSHDNQYAYRMIWQEAQKRLKFVKKQVIIQRQYYHTIFQELFELADQSHREAFNQMKQVKMNELIHKEKESYLQTDSEHLTDETVVERPIPVGRLEEFNLLALEASVHLLNPVYNNINNISNISNN